MTGPRAYISGPIFGRTDDELRNFARCAVALDKIGATPVNPLEISVFAHEGDCPPGRRGEAGHTDACHLRADIAAMLGCDAICLIPGWTESWGVRIELSTATACGLAVWQWWPDRDPQLEVLPSVSSTRWASPVGRR